MMRGTTPTHSFVLPIDTSEIKNVIVTYKQNGEIKLEKKSDELDMDGKVISCRLTQEETLAFAGDTEVKLQVRVLTKNGDALASAVMRVSCANVLNDEVLV